MREHFKVTQTGATQAELDELVQQLGHDLPDSYLAMLRETNGAEWCMHDQRGDCLNFWKAQDVPEANHNYQIQHYLPEVVAIGSDGGSRTIILYRSAGHDANLWPVFRVDFGALDREEFIFVAEHFLHWARHGFRLPI